MARRWLAQFLCAGVKKRVALTRGPNTTQPYKPLYWAGMGWGLEPDRKAIAPTTPISVLSSRLECLS